MRVSKTIQFQRYDLETMAEILQLDIARARFIAACSHSDPRDYDGNVQPLNRGKPILYDERVLIAEACRLGISAKDTAKMMNLPKQRILEYAAELSIRFRSVSRHKPQSSKGVHTLFQYEPPDPYRCRT